VVANRLLKTTGKAIINKEKTMKNAANTATRSRTGAEVRERTHAGLDDMTRVSIKLMGAVSGVIGIWAVAALLVAMMHAGGPLALAKSWFGAVTGVG
jgi:hypothetical protein